MAISLVGTPPEVGNGTGANLTLTLPGGMAQNDVVLVAINYGAIVAPTMVTSGYTLYTGADVQNANPDPRLRVFWKAMGSTPDTTAVVTGTGSSADAASATCYVLRGANAGDPVDAAATAATGASGQPNSPPITTVTPGAWVISAVGAITNDTTVTAPAGYSDKVDINASAAQGSTSGMARILKAAAGVEDPPAWSSWNSVPWVALSLAIKPAGLGRSQGYIF